MDGDTDASGSGPGSAGSAKYSKKALKEWVADNCGWTTTGRLEAAFEHCPDEQLRAVLMAAPEVPLQVIASQAYEASRKPSKAVRYDAAEVAAACLRKFGCAEGFAAKMAANEKAAEKRAETMALKGTSAGRKMHVTSGDDSAGSGSFGASGGFGGFGTYGGAGGGAAASKGRNQLDNPNPDGLGEWDEYLECYKCRRKAPIGCINRFCKLCCTGDKAAHCPQHRVRASDGWLKGFKW